MDKDSAKEKLIVGITGGIGTGKTTFANIIEKKGFHVIYTDSLAKDIISTCPAIRKQIIKIFGEHSFFGGTYNTQYVSAIVFNDSNKLKLLNQIVFPPVIEKLLDIIDSLQASEHKLIFVETALLFEFELENGFDYVVSVTASKEVRIQRLMQYRHMTEEAIQKRIKKQMPQEEVNRFSDFVIENNTDIVALESSADFLLSILQTLPNKEIEGEADVS